MYPFDHHGTQLKAGDTVRTQAQTTAVIVRIGTQGARGVWVFVKNPGNPFGMWWEQSVDLTYVESDQ